MEETKKTTKKTTTKKTKKVEAEKPVEVLEASIIEVEEKETAIVPSTRIVTDSQGNELVVYGENNEVLSCTFERVDFNEPTSIMSYCGGVKDEISRILDDSARLAADSQEAQVTDKMIESITAFDKSLDDSEKEREKLENENALIRKGKEFLGWLGVEKYKNREEQTTYKGRYEEYRRNIEEVCAAVESQKQGSLNDMELRAAIVRDMTPFVEQLNEMVTVGKMDKENFDAETQALKQLPQDEDRVREIQLRERLSEVFNTRLDSLGKAVVLYKEQIQTYQLQQITEMTTITVAAAFLEDSAPILQAQGSVKVLNHQQETRIDTLKRLTEATNAAVIDNAKDLEQNAHGAASLMLNNGVSAESLVALDASLRRGAEIYRNARAQKQQQIAKNSVILEKIKQSSETFNNELIELIDGTGSLFTEVYKDNGSLGVSHTKKLGTRKGRK